MPTYEYRCPKGHEFECFQRMSEEPVFECPECGESAERLLSGGAGFIFKGEGFYITDYRSDDYKKAASSDKEGGPAKAKKSDSAKGESSSSSSTKTPASSASDNNSSKPSGSSKPSSSD